MIAKRGTASRWTAGILGGASALLLVIAFGSSRQSLPKGISGLSGGSGYKQFPEAIRALMKPGDQGIEFVGNRFSSKEHLVAADHYVTIPLRKGAVVYQDGIRCEVARAQFVGERMDVRLDLSGPIGKMSNVSKGLMLVIRYGNGYWGFPCYKTRSIATRSLPGAGVAYKMESALLVSPLVYPWCRDREAFLRGAELHVLLQAEFRKSHLTLMSLCRDIPIGKTMIKLSFPYCLLLLVRNNCVRLLLQSFLNFKLDGEEISERPLNYSLKLVKMVYRMCLHFLHTVTMRGTVTSRI
jgi:hypothetical protein